MRAFINPGHAPNGNPDPGAVNPYNGLRECDIALTAGQMLQKYLEAAGVETQLLQSDDLGEVCAASNAWGADLFISLHCNASGEHNAYGTETWYKTFNGQRLASCIQSSMVRSMSMLEDRGVKQTDSLWVLNGTNAVAALVEMGFIDNQHDVDILTNDLDTLVRAVARGVTDF